MERSGQFERVKLRSCNINDISSSGIVQTTVRAWGHAFSHQPGLQANSQRRQCDEPSIFGSTNGSVLILLGFSVQSAPGMLGGLLGRLGSWGSLCSQFPNCLLISFSSLGFGLSGGFHGLLGHAFYECYGSYVHFIYPSVLCAVIAPFFMILSARSH
jgi:hypothetical protein